MPRGSHHARSSRTLAMLTGWPPAMFTVPASETYGTFAAPTSATSALQLGQVDVALERVERLRVVGLVDDDVVEGRPGQLLVEPGRREVHVAGDVVAGLDQRLADQVLGAATLVRGDEVRGSRSSAGRPPRGGSSCGCPRRPRRPASSRPTGGRSWPTSRSRSGGRCRRRRCGAGTCCSRPRQSAATRCSRVVTVSGSTILIFHGSAQLRRPCCWPIVWSGSCAIGLAPREVWYGAGRSGRR